MLDENPLTRDLLRYAPIETLLDIVRNIVSSKTGGLVHPHGFFVVSLFRNPLEEWRFHVWPKGQKERRGLPASIHTHDVDIDSRILLGELINIDYDVNQSISGSYHVYEVTYQGDKYAGETANCLSKSSDRVHAYPTCRRNLKSGDFYQIKSHTFHEAIVEQEKITATLVCMHSRCLGAVKVLCDDGFSEQISFKRTAVTSQDVLNLIR